MGFKVCGLRVGGDLYVGRLRLGRLGGGAGLVAGLDLGVSSWKEDSQLKSPMQQDS